MKLKFRVVSATLQEARDGERTISVRLVPTKHDDNRAVWELPPSGCLELNGLIPRTGEILRVGTDIDLVLLEAS